MDRVGSKIFIVCVFFLVSSCREAEVNGDGVLSVLHLLRFSSRSFQFEWQFEKSAKYDKMFSLLILRQLLLGYTRDRIK